MVRRRRFCVVYVLLLHLSLRVSSAINNAVVYSLRELFKASHASIYGEKFAPAIAPTVHWWQQSTGSPTLGTGEVSFHKGIAWTQNTLTNRTHVTKLKSNIIIVSRIGVSFCIEVLAHLSNTIDGPYSSLSCGISLVSNMKTHHLALPATTVESIPQEANLTVRIWLQLSSEPENRLGVSTTKYRNIPVSSSREPDTQLKMEASNVPFISGVIRSDAISGAVLIPEYTFAPDLTLSKEKFLATFGKLCMDFVAQKETNSATKRCIFFDRFGSIGRIGYSGAQSPHQIPGGFMDGLDDLTHSIEIVFTPRRNFSNRGPLPRAVFVVKDIKLPYSSTELQMAAWSAVYLCSFSAHISVFYSLTEQLKDAGGCDRGILHSASFLPYIPMHSTPLMIATRFGWERGVREILTLWLGDDGLAKCSPVDVRDRDGQNILEVATTYSSKATPKIMAMLIDTIGIETVLEKQRLVIGAQMPTYKGGLSYERKVEYACLSLANAARYNHVKTFAYMHSTIKWKSANPLAVALLMASESGNVAIVKTLLEADHLQANPALTLNKAIVPRTCSEWDRYGTDHGTHRRYLMYTALIAATRNGHSNIVREIAAHLPGSIEVMDMSGFTAIMWAAFPGTKNGLESAKELVAAGADPTRPMNHGSISFLDSVKDTEMLDVLESSFAFKMQQQVKQSGRDIAVCFRGYLRSFHTVKYDMMERWFEPLRQGQSKLSYMSVEAWGDRKFQEAYETSTFKPLVFDTHVRQPKRANWTFTENYDMSILESCLPYDILRGVSSSLEVLLLTLEDINLCADSIEALEAERGAEFTHVFLLRPDIRPDAHLKSEYLAGLDSAILVPARVRLGIDETLAIGPRRYMMKYLRGLKVDTLNLLSRAEKCERVTNSEFMVRDMLAKEGMPVLANPWLNSKKIREAGFCTGVGDCIRL
jgi:hypothetical protein